MLSLCFYATIVRSSLIIECWTWDLERSRRSYCVLRTQGEASTGESAQALAQNCKTVLHPLALRGRTLAARFTAQRVSQPATDWFLRVRMFCWFYSGPFVLIWPTQSSGHWRKCPSYPPLLTQWHRLQLLGGSRLRVPQHSRKQALVFIPVLLCQSLHHCNDVSVSVCADHLLLILLMF